MKRYLTILLFLLSITVSAQFPAPSNFQLSYIYAMIGEWTHCADSAIYGPTYCSDFSWDASDTGATSSSLEYYTIYYHRNQMYDTIEVASLTETFYQVELGVMGKVWVTATYSNPDGESAPSNIIINNDLPILVEEQTPVEEITVFHDKASQIVIVRNADKAMNINIVDSQGNIVKYCKPENNRINISDFAGGLYIIEVFDDNSKVIRKKIVK